MKNSFKKPDINISSIAVIGDYLPRKCGIATFTTDLVQSLSGEAKNCSCKAIALNDKTEGYDYSDEVRFEIDEGTLTDYNTAADFLNINQADIICLQHEFGIFGGKEGKNILNLLRKAQMPIVTTLHTVLVEPTKTQKSIMLELAKLSARLVVMSKTAVGILQTVYDIPKEQIAFIPHGIPDMPFVDPNYYKDKFDLLGRKVLLTFGLLSENKGIEYVIKGLPKVVEKFPDIAYIVLGATHPHVIEYEGEKYREKLHRLVKKLDLEEHVIFENHFVPYDELCDYLAATDLYITPYNNEDQITSGTLAYASGTGKAVISTPYWYAKDMLDDGRGQLVPFKDEEAMSEAIIDLFENEAKRHQMRKRAYDYNRDSTWSSVARQYLDLFEEVKLDQNHRPKPQGTAVSEKRHLVDGNALPPLKLDHLLTLSDDTGMLQHAIHTIPDREHGYCTDDNARALIVSLKALTLSQTSQHDLTRLGTLSNRFLSFLLHAFNSDNGRFRNFLNYSRQWQNSSGSDDAHGRALWALGVTASLSNNGPHLPLTSTLFMRSLETAESFRSLRAVAFSIIGVDGYLKAFPGDSKAQRVGLSLSEHLGQSFKENTKENWLWPEDILTYCNAKLPHALLIAGDRFKKKHLTRMGLDALEWLLHIETENGHLAPVGNKGWLQRGEEKARFDQQPLEANALTEACIAAYHITGKEQWLHRARLCFSWFLGNNDLQLPLYNNSTGGCRDGLQSDRLNQNEGAESTLAWLLTLCAMYELEKEELVQPAIETKSEVS